MVFSMSEDLTIAKVVTISSDKPIKIPPEFVELLGKKNAIFVLSKASSEARLIPTDGAEIVKVFIKIGKLSQKFLKDLGSVIVKNKVNFLYTTGLCRKGKLCYYEGYIDKTYLKTDIETFKKDLQEIEGVISVEVTTITPD